MISLFLLLLGGSFTSFSVTFALVIPPLTVKNRPCALIWACALNRKNMVLTVLEITDTEISLTHMLHVLIQQDDEINHMVTTQLQHRDYKISMFIQKCKFNYLVFCIVIKFLVVLRHVSVEYPIGVPKPLTQVKNHLKNGH